MIRVTTLFALLCVGLLATAVSPSKVHAQRGAQQYENRPDYRNRHRHPHYRQPSQSYYQNGWYQRPYPYHLDYYRMKYGGSYEPYFGNLYGPPRIYNFGPVSPAFGGAFFW